MSLPTVEIELESGKKFKFLVRQKIVDYLDIQVIESKTNLISQKHKSCLIVGKSIKVPTKSKDNNNNIRYTLIRVPNTATNYAIAVWIKSTFKNMDRKPAYFLIPSGRHYPTNIPSWIEF